MKKQILSMSMLLLLSSFFMEARTSISQFSCDATSLSIDSFPPDSAKAACDERVVSYQDIKPILVEKCENCHNGILAPDYTSYETMRPSAEEGAFEIRVFIRKDMPIKEELTEEELALLRCWLETGYTEGEATDNTKTEEGEKTEEIEEAEH